MRVGFLGLGIMGRGMAANLAKKGHAVTAWNRTKSRAAALTDSGVTVAATPADAARGAEAVALCLSDPPAVESAVFGAGGVMEALASGSVLVDFSTGSPAMAKRLDEAARSKGARFVESPVTGSKAGAAAGTLTLMCGGEDASLAQAKPVLDAISSKLIHVGPVGSASRVKLMGNTIIGLMLEALCEGVVLCEKAGIPPAKLLEVIQASGYASPYWDFKGKAILAGDFDTNFSVDLMHKDLTLALESANELKVPVPGLALVREQFQSVRAMGGGGEDIAALIKAVRRAAAT